MKTKQVLINKVNTTNRKHDTLTSNRIDHEMQPNGFQ